MERVTANRNRPDHEVTAAIVDSIHTLCYLLKDRDMGHPDVAAAVSDLFENSEGFSKIMGAITDKWRNDGVKIKL